MTTAFEGRLASPGMAEGRLHVVLPRVDASMLAGATTEDERDRLTAALAEAERQLIADTEQALSADDHEAAEVFEAHLVMLTDPDFGDAALEAVNASGSAAGAVADVAGRLASVFENAESEYLQARITDLHDIRDRVLDALSGREREGLALGPGVILAAEDFTPSMTVGLTAATCGGIVTTGGSYTSHASISPATKESRPSPTARYRPCRTWPIAARC